MRQNHEHVRPSYGPLVPCCGTYGINRTTAYYYSKIGLLDTFVIGKKRYVYLASLESLPERAGKLSEALAEVA